MENENEINEKILKITMIIRNQYPELSKYLEEMRITIPDEKIPKITAEDLATYYDSLVSFVNKYKLEQSVKKLN